jgi:hypothetical protein
MSEQSINFLSGTLTLAAGVLILQTLDALARFDQHSGGRLNDWFGKKLGNSGLNRELWSVGTPSGFRSSKIGLRVAGVILLLAGTVLVGLSLGGHFH